MREVSLDDLFSSNIERLLEGKTTTDFQNILEVENQISTIIAILRKRYPLPEEKKGENQSEYSARWKKSFSKIDLCLHDSLSDWSFTVIPSLLSILQTINLLVTPLTQKELKRRAIKGQEEWFELMFSLYFQQTIIFRNRLVAFFKHLNKSVQDNYSGDDYQVKTLISELRNVPNFVEKCMSNLTSVRDDHVHKSPFTDQRWIDIKISRLNPEAGRNYQNQLEKLRTEYAINLQKDYDLLLALLEREAELVSRCFEYLIERSEDITS